RAYKTYSATIESLPRVTQIDIAIRSQRFSLANSWVLANEIRSGEASFEECKKCNSTFFFTQLQQVECTCPFCKQIELQKISAIRKKDGENESESQLNPIGMAAG